MKKESTTDLEKKVRSLSESSDRAVRRLEDIDDSAKLGFDAAILVHELSNILGGMMGHVQLAQITGNPDDMKKCLDVLGSGLLRTRDLIASFKLAITQGRSRAMIDLHDEIRKAMVILEDDFSRNGIAWKLEEKRSVFFSDPSIIRKAVFICALTAARGLLRDSVLEVKIREGRHSVEIDFFDSKRPDSAPVDPPLRPTAPTGLDSEWDYLKALIMEIGGQVEKLGEGNTVTGCRILLPS